jgi:hypothetical protein
VLCRLGFVLFCLVPTLAVGVWVVFGRLAQSPAATARESQGAAVISAEQFAGEISSHLGLNVQIDSIDAKQQNLHLEGLRLIDPETGDLVLHAAAIDAHWQDDRWRIEAHQPVVKLAHARRLLPRLHDRLLCGPFGSTAAIEISAASLLVQSGTDSQSFGPAHVRIDERLDNQPSQRWLAIELAPVGSAAAGPLRLTASRVRSAVRPHTNWQLSTSGAAVPLAAFAAMVPQLSRLGTNCHFAGTLGQVESDGTTRLAVQGTLTSVDFDSLVTEHFPHQLSGRGTIQIEAATLEDGRLLEFQGGIDIGGGSASPSLLAAAQQYLGLVLAAEPPASEYASVPFERLALRLSLDGRRLRIRGAGEHAGQAVMIGSGGPLLSAPLDYAVPAVNLLRALLPDNQFQVPATRQTDALVGLLPVPDLAPMRTAARQSHVPTRLRDSGPADAAPVLRQPGLR